MKMHADVDWVIVGSGFGGSVPALRLAEKGYDVLVLEQGRRFEDADFAKTARELRKLVWVPKLGLKGIMAITPFKHVSVISGVGVGGGSLVYGNTLYVPTADEFFEHEQWGELADWRAELAPHYLTAQRMLGVTTYVGDGPSEAMMHKLATELGVADSIHTTEVGVFFGTPGKRVPDPYFDGRGPDRTGCIRCGQCMLGCRHNAKNTLVKNYLHLAQRLGARVDAERKVVDIRPLGAADGGDGYAVTTVRSGRWFRRDVRTVHTRGVIVAAGALGTTRLLRALKDSGALPKLSDRIGDLVRTNSESIVAATARGRDLDWTTDIAITTSVHPDGHTHFTNNTYGAGGDLLGLLFGPSTSGAGRRRQLLRSILVHPLVWLHPRRLKGWSRRSVLFTVMQSLDSSLRLRPSRLTKRLTTEIGAGTPPASDLLIAQRVGSLAAQIMKGDAQSSVLESLMGTSTTAHILGGAVIGASPERGVVDRYRRAFGYRNLLVTDGSTMPANVGVNPSLTITAMAEEAMEHIPAKQLQRDNPDAAYDVISSHVHPQRLEVIKTRAPSIIGGGYDASTNSTRDARRTERGGRLGELALRPLRRGVPGVRAWPPRRRRVHG
jgi:cholesterol oxidase